MRVCVEVRERDVETLQRVARGVGRSFEWVVQECFSLGMEVGKSGKWATLWGEVEKEKKRKANRNRQRRRRLRLKAQRIEGLVGDGIVERILKGGKEEKSVLELLNPEGLE